MIPNDIKKKIDESLPPHNKVISIETGRILDAPRAYIYFSEIAKSITENDRVCFICVNTIKYPEVSVIPINKVFDKNETLEKINQILNTIKIMISDLEQAQKDELSSRPQ